MKRLKAIGRLTFVFVVSCFSLAVIAQTNTTKLYDPNANAAADIEAAIRKAATENKFVLIQAGGNWCGWCIEFARFCKADPQIDTVIKNSFVEYHLNYSKENRNDALFSTFGNPQHLGFPVFIILNGKGERIHTQSSAVLENGGKSYDQEKVLDFLDNWTPKSFAGKTFDKQ